MARNKRLVGDVRLARYTRTPLYRLKMTVVKVNSETSSTLSPALHLSGNFKHILPLIATAGNKAQEFYPLSRT